MGAGWLDPRVPGASGSGAGDPRDDRVEELAAHVRELDAQLRARAGSPDASPDAAKLTARLVDRVEVLAERVDTLAEIARSASSGVVARERELAAIRGEVGDARARLESAIVEFQRTDRAPVEDLQRRVSMLSDDVTALQQSRDGLAERVNTLGASAEGARSTITAHERALAELTKEVDALGARMDSVVVVVRQAVESLLAQVQTTDDPSAGAQALDRFAARQNELAEAQQRLEARLEELAAKLGQETRPRLVGDTGGSIATFGGGR